MFEHSRRRRVSRHGRPIVRRRPSASASTRARYDETEPLGDEAMLQITRLMLEHLVRNGAATEPHMFGIGGAAEASQELYELALADAETNASSFTLQQLLSRYSLHTIGHCLKRIIRMLPIVTAHDWQRILRAYDTSQPSSRPDDVSAVVELLATDSSASKLFLNELLALLARVSLNERETKMTSRRLGYVFGLALLAPLTDASPQQLTSTELHEANNIIALLIAHYARRLQQTTSTTSICKPTPPSKKTSSRDIVVPPDVEVRLYQRRRPSDDISDKTSSSSRPRLLRKNASEPPSMQPSTPFRFSRPAQCRSVERPPPLMEEHRDVLKHSRRSIPQLLHSGVGSSDVGPSRSILVSPETSSFIQRALVQQMASDPLSVDAPLRAQRSRSKSATEVSRGRRCSRSRLLQRSASYNRIASPSRSVSLATTFSLRNGFIDSNAVTTAENELQRLVPLRIVDDDDGDDDGADDIGGFSVEPIVVQLPDEFSKQHAIARQHSLSWKHASLDVDANIDSMPTLRQSEVVPTSSLSLSADVKREEGPTTIISTIVDSTREFDATRNWAKARWKSMGNILRRPSVELRPRPSCPIDSLSTKALEGVGRREHEEQRLTVDVVAPRSNSATYSVQHFAAVNKGRHQRTSSVPAGARPTSARHLRGFGSNDFSSHTTNDDEFGVVPFRIVDVDTSNIVEAPLDDGLHMPFGSDENGRQGLEQAERMQSSPDSPLVVISEEAESDDAELASERVGRDAFDDDDDDKETSGVEASTVVSLRFEDLPLNLDTEQYDASQALWRRAYDEHNSSKLRRSQSRRASVVDELDALNGSRNQAEPKSLKTTADASSPPSLRDEVLRSKELFSRSSRPLSSRRQQQQQRQRPLLSSEIRSVRSPSRILTALEALREPIRHVQESYSQTHDPTPASIIASQTGAKLWQRWNRLDDIVRTLVDRNRQATTTTTTTTTTQQPLPQHFVVVTSLLTVVNVAMLLSVLALVVRTQAAHDAIDVGTIAFVASLSWPLLRCCCSSGGLRRVVLTSTSVAAFSTLLLSLSGALFSTVFVASFVMSCGVSLARLLSALLSGRPTSSPSSTSSSPVLPTDATISLCVLVGIYIAFASHAYLASLPALLVGIGLASTHVVCTLLLLKHVNQRSLTSSSLSSLVATLRHIHPSSLVRMLALSILCSVIYISDYVSTFVFGVIVTSTCSVLLPSLPRARLQALSLVVVLLMTFVVIDVSFVLALAAGASVGVVYVATWSQRDVDLFLFAASTFSFGTFLISVLIDSFLAADKHVYVVMQSVAVMIMSSRFRSNML